MYLAAIEMLKHAGCVHYEISTSACRALKANTTVTTGKAATT